MSCIFIMQDFTEILRAVSSGCALCFVHCRMVSHCTAWFFFLINHSVNNTNKMTRMHSPDNDENHKDRNSFSNEPLKECRMSPPCCKYAPWGLNVTKKGLVTPRQNTTSSLIPISICYISYSKHMNERGQHTESSHWAYRE